MDQTFITRIVEAALLAANQPLTLAQLHGLFPLDEPAPQGSVEQALETLREQSADRGIELVEVASGFRYQVQADVHAWVARLWSERQTKYTRATLETLALIAYRQPITRGEIEQIRGVAVNSNIIKALEEREWIRVVGHRDMPGKPELLGTTRAFLDYFGLQRLDQLPPLSELKDFGELEPQLQFEPGPIVVDNISDLGRTDMAEADANPEAGEAAGTATGDDSHGASTPVVVADEATAEPEHDTLGEERADSDPAIADAATHNQSQPSIEPDTEFQPALAEEGDSTGARHE
jgi:segregation and condensation protein B